VGCGNEVSKVSEVLGREAMLLSVRRGRGAVADRGREAMRTMDYEWFVAEGCVLAKPDPMMLLLIHRSEGGDPCKRCNCKADCPAWPKVRILQAGK